MMQPDQQMDPMTILLAKVEELEKRLKTITDDNTAIKQQNVRNIAFESLKKELMRGRQ